jgi:DNA-binding NarL/FixJ family response regulator
MGEGHRGSNPKQPVRDLLALTEAELRTAKLVAMGLCNKDIAEIAMVKTDTIAQQRKEAMDKLGVHNAMDLARVMIERGMITIDAWLSYPKRKK